MNPFPVQRLLKALDLAMSYCGSLRGVATKSIEVLRAEGLGGLRLRLRILLDHSTAEFDQTKIRPPVLARTGRTANAMEARTQPVDIIVCVHNAPDDTRCCLESVVEHTAPPYRIIIVDDGSAEETARHLERFASARGAVLIRNQSACGYTLAANIGLRASTGAFVVLLNSDTIVSPAWLDRMVACALSDERIGVVGPLSNTASWQSVPRLTGPHGTWADNPLPPGWTVARMACAIARVAPRVYPRVGFVNGFCFMIRRTALEAVGLFDEETFARGYGEENDFCLRAVANNWQLAIADDAYVFHSESKSYLHDRRRELTHLASEALASKHGELSIIEQLRWTKNHPILEYMRRRCATIAEEAELKDYMRNQFAGKRILFVLPITTAGGGGNVVLCEVAALRSHGIDAQIVNLEFNRGQFERHHPDLDVPVAYVRSPVELTAFGASFDAVVATFYLSVDWLKPLAESDKKTITAYYVQDFEPYFFQQHSREYEQALASYTRIPAMHLFTKTRWTQDCVYMKTGVQPALVGPSYDADNFFPNPNVPHTDTPIVLIAMVRPNSPRRAPELTMRLLRRLKRRFGDAITIHIFGTRPDDPGYLTTKRDFEHVCLGELSSPEVAEALRLSDIFLDLSSFQAMGLTAMEAMASGAAVVGPINGGLGEVIENERTGLLVDTREEAACFAAASRLIVDTPLRLRLRNDAFEVTRWTPTRSAAAMLEAIFATTSGNRPQTGYTS